jgi:alcohol dehydrogenase/L-iditol 2-dehydrogenase
MKAALLVAPERIEIGEVAQPEPGPGDVRVAVHGVGLCGSDLSVFSGRWQTPLHPWVMGHEAYGVIDAVGDDVPAERIGQTVVVEPNIVCFSCRHCRAGRTSACEARSSVGMNRPGALAEWLVLPSRFAWPVPPRAPEDLVCYEPTSVVLAALRRLGGELPPSALVVGVGAQGLLMTLVLLERGLAVHVIDVNRDRVALAETFGALPVPDRPDQSWRLVVDTVGSPASTETGFGHLDVGGTLLYLGLDGRPLGLTAQALVRRQAVLRGSLTYDHPGDFESAIDLIGGGRIVPGRIVTDEYSLDDAQHAFEGSAAAPGKTWIRIKEGPPRS